jgi:DNA-binding NarL/FixJ family response regulator
MSILPGGQASEEQKELVPTSIYLVEDSELTRAVIRESLLQYEGLKLVGEAEDGTTAIKQALDLNPDVIIVDIGLPGMNGLEVLKQIKAQLPETRVVVLTSQDSESSMFKAFSAGADAYLTKDEFTPEKLEEAIRDVNAGSQWLDPSIAKEVLTQSDQAPVQVPKLTEEEERVLKLVAEEKVPLKQQRRSKYRSYAKDSLADEVLTKIEADTPAGKNDWKDFMQRLNRFKGEE